jgi:hypothetical protein
MFARIQYRTWKLISHLREDYKLKVFEKKVLRRIFEPNKQDVTGVWWEFRNKELYNLHYSTNIVIFSHLKLINILMPYLFKTIDDNLFFFLLLEKTQLQHTM